MSSFLKDPTVQIVAGYFPKLTTIILAVVSFALGLIWAYGIQPVQYVNGDPSQLEQSWQDQWVVGAAGRLSNANANSVEPSVEAMLQAVDDPAGIVNRLINDPNYAAEAGILSAPAFQGVVQRAQPNAAAPPPRSNVISDIVGPIVVIIVFAFLLVLGKVLWTLLIYPFIEPLIAGRETTDASQEIDRIKKQRQIETDMKTATVDTTRYGEPIIRKASLFRAGFGNYDDSFNIETGAGLYYGEAGASIAEKIGEDDVTAIEVWMFDKDEFTNTPAGIFATEYAMNDPALRSRLEPRGKLVKMEVGAQIVLETDALYIEATVRDLEYDPAAEHPQSVLQNSTIEVIAWAKSGGPGDGSGLPTPDTVPAPAIPSADPVGSSGGQTPLAPPPLNPDAGPFAPPDFGPPATSGGNQGQGQSGGNSAPPPPDDPFGGAGDFTPVNRD